MKIRLRLPSPWFGALPRGSSLAGTCTTYTACMPPPQRERMAVRLNSLPAGIQLSHDASGGTPGRSTRQWSTLIMLEYLHKVSTYGSFAHSLSSR